MLDASWHGLLASSGVVALFISLWSFSPLAADCSTPARKLAFGLLFGLGAMVCMTAAVEVRPGLIIDLRNVLIVLAAFFGGPISAIVAVSVAALHRLELGGAGVIPGISIMVAHAALGIVAHRLVRHRQPQALDIVLLSVACAVLGLAIHGFVPAVRIAANWALTMTAFGFVATLAAGIAMKKEIKRQALARTGHIHRAISLALPDCLNVKDAEGRFIAANPATARLMRATGEAELIGKSDFDFYPAQTARLFKAAEDEIVAARQPHTIEQLVTHRDGSTAWLSTLKVPVFDERGRFQGLITHNRDISDRKRLETELTHTQQIFSAALANMSDGLVMFDAQEHLVFCNERYHAMFPMTRDIRQPGACLEHILRESLRRGEKTGDGLGSLEMHLAAIRRLHEKPVAFFAMADGRWLESRVTHGADGSYIIVYSDVTDVKLSQQRLEAVNEQLREIAQTDAVTGLLNRRALDQILESELSRSARGLGPVSLLLIDVDRFKAFNDTYGHVAGDHCLRSVAACIRNSVGRLTDRTARFGGEEFAVVLPGTSVTDALKVANKMRRAIHTLAMPHSGSEYGAVTFSIGVACAPSGVRIDMVSLIAEADAALYRAKNSGRDCIAVAGDDAEPIQVRAIA